ncbi:DMT family transporter [[Clostridium] innocuum]|nr:DMT family transporter [[Clostridium] innocuum]
MTVVLSVLLALLAGISIVISRSINALLAEKTNALTSSFFNYVTGCVTSMLFLLLFGISSLSKLSQLQDNGNLFLLLGGVIGVLNIILLNHIVPRIPPVQLTLLVFIAQLLSGMLLDSFLLNLFSLQKLAGCFLVVIGMLLYTHVSHPTNAKDNSHLR